MADETSQAERRLSEHLELLRAAPPSSSTALTRRVVRTARWQRAVRVPLRVVGMVAGGLVDGIAALLGLRRGRRG